MHKEIIICLTIIIFVIVLNTITMSYTKTIVDEMDLELNKFKRNILEGNIEDETIKLTNRDIKNKWREKYNVLAYYIEHDELEKVETELTALEASIEVEEYDDGIENLERCIFILNHIKDKYSLDIKNIF